MTFKSRFLAITLIFWLVSLACLGVAPSPAETVTPLPGSTATPVPGGGPAQPDDLETATVAEVIDGDTIELTTGRRVRYIGINTPERDQPYYDEAKETNRRLTEGREVQLELDLDTFDQYGRRLAYVWVDGAMVNLELVRQGYANAFTIPPNVRYEEEFRQAEQAAREAGRGLWTGSAVKLKIIHLEADAPGSDPENPNGEWIEIANQGGEPVQMAGYTLKDAANHIYTFGDFTLPAGGTFRLYSGRGSDSAAELYWGLMGDSVWNNDTDSAFLRDAQGALVDTFEY